jgi:hypothetical protein
MLRRAARRARLLPRVLIQKFDDVILARVHLEPLHLDLDLPRCKALLDLNPVYLHGLGRSKFSTGLNVRACTAWNHSRAGAFVLGRRISLSAASRLIAPGRLASPREAPFSFWIAERRDLRGSRKFRSRGSPDAHDAPMLLAKDP